MIQIHDGGAWREASDEEAMEIGMAMEGQPDEVSRAWARGGLVRVAMWVTDPGAGGAQGEVLVRRVLE